MVTVKLIGRAGNQMFQLATAYAHAKRVGAEFYRPKYTQAQAIWPMYFPHIPIAPNNYVEKEWLEPSHAYTPIPSELKSVRLEGYFQSEKYFKDIDKEDIRSLFKINPIQRKGCAIHIRLGDYLQMQDKHPVIADEYIRKSISYVYYFGIDDFYLFSEDTKLALEMVNSCVPQLINDINIHVQQPGRALSDLELMASFEHQIISNSSYSWWAAWLNPNQEKIVVAPNTWFGPGNSHLDTKDLIPEEWIRF